MTCMKVGIKIRALLHYEVQANMKEECFVQGNKIICPSKSLDFDHVFGSESLNSDAYLKIVQPIVQSSLNGFNGTIFAYGQTSAGKTHTMMGTDDDPGIIILAIRQIFKGNDAFANRQFMIRVGYVEIFDEKIYDLLNSRKEVRLTNRNEKSDVEISNKEVIVNDAEMLLKVLHKGDRLRLMKSTDYNQFSNRSHTIFRMVIESEAKVGASVQVSYLNFIDLTGSEGSYIKDEQGSNVNKSLFSLGGMINMLSTGCNTGYHLKNYQNSKLTQMLKGSLGGNANTALICNITPIASDQTTNTLNFADKARNVRNDAVRNKVYNNEPIMKQIQAEIAFMQGELAFLKSEYPESLKSEKSDKSEKEKLQDDIAQKNAIFLIGKNMRPISWNQYPTSNTPGPSKYSCLDKAAGQKATRQTVNFRACFSLTHDRYNFKYLIGELRDSAEYQTRLLRKANNNTNSLMSSKFYLERVGFELNVNLRHDLKYGNNLIGRSGEDIDVDISINAMGCSRRHCMINVITDDIVTVQDLKSSNGTSVNGTKISQEVELKEKDMIGIVGGPKWDLVGNYNYVVFRLCRYTSHNVKTYLIEDDPIVISDGDDDDLIPSSFVKIKVESDKPSKRLSKDPEPLSKDTEPLSKNLKPLSNDTEPLSNVLEPISKDLPNPTTNHSVQLDNVAGHGNEGMIENSVDEVEELVAVVVSPPLNNISSGSSNLPIESCANRSADEVLTKIVGEAIDTPSTPLSSDSVDDVPSPDYDLVEPNSHSTPLMEGIDESSLPNPYVLLHYYAIPLHEKTDADDAKCAASSDDNNVEYEEPATPSNDAINVENQGPATPSNDEMNAENEGPAVPSSNEMNVENEKREALSSDKTKQESEGPAAPFKDENKSENEKLGIKRKRDLEFVDIEPLDKQCKTIFDGELFNFDIDKFISENLLEVEVPLVDQIDDACDELKTHNSELGIFALELEQCAFAHKSNETLLSHEKEIADLSTKLQSTLMERNQLQQEVDFLKVKLNAVDADREALHKQIFLNTKDIVKMRGMNKIIEADREALQQKNLNDTTEIETLRKKNENKAVFIIKQQQTLILYENEITKLKAQLTEVTNAKEQAEMEFAKDDEKLCSLSKELTALVKKKKNVPKRRVGVVKVVKSIKKCGATKLTSVEPILSEKVVPDVDSLNSTGSNF